MPRLKHCRKICEPPKMLGYKPFGIPKNALPSVTLGLDEFEVIRLLDYEGLNQEQAAERMKISRPTLTRIYEHARKVVATAFVEGKMLIIQGGEVEFDKEWYRCKRCHTLIAGCEEQLRCKNCKTFCPEEMELIYLKNE